MEPYIIIGTRKCTYCDQAKSLLIDRYSDYTSYDLDTHPWLKTLFKMTKLKTVPQVFRGSGELIGGYAELKVHLEGLFDD
jgi:glutaredoxin